MWRTKIEKFPDKCRILLQPESGDLTLGGYGLKDIVVYRGAPVSINALEKKLNEILEAKLLVKGNSLIVELNANCEKLIELVLNTINKMLADAEKDLIRLERVICESVKKYVEKNK
ncbi:hypothetical protein B6U96_10495 [Archaeoglobales archaeon ex4484_92]|nr:MAG: hypothetical protein B6U96_10495 [Archaeoglobales archaeon ex4484_92]